MADGISIEIKGLEEIQRAMVKMVSGMTGDRMVRAMKEATLMVQRDARIFAPVDTGRLRASIVPEVRVNGLGISGVQGVVGTNVVYAPHVELRPARHKVGRMHYLRDAFIKNKDAIFAKINAAVREIVRGK